MGFVFKGVTESSPVRGLMMGLEFAQDIPVRSNPSEGEGRRLFWRGCLKGMPTKAGGSPSTRLKGLTAVPVIRTVVVRENPDVEAVARRL